MTDENYPSETAHFAGYVILAEVAISSTGSPFRITGLSNPNAPAHSL
jgi:hypothetical protein